ncbi:N-acetylmuramoyl-L-alanine amidase [Fulvivirgaceae bacterium PWU37]|uniref:N-acetylmuramoyl-L-alanine amidase n=1 Tax=Dawidia soli TaxID=2782352 RepID=A0AAP2GBU5_9BACT|nr:N-acetylmuramoyl-L-alanine amidase [Dawidia soli]
MSKKRRRLKCRTNTGLKVRFLAFSEKFTFLRKVIANTLNIVRPVRNIGLTLLLIAITLLNSLTVSAQHDSKVDLVVIDAGHGGKDNGTRGKKVKEKDLALKIALLVGEYIEKNVPDVKVIYTRKDDRYLPLDERAAIANKAKADLFICIHANANPNAKAYGTETFVMGMHVDEKNLEVAKRENSVILMDKDYKDRYEGFEPNSPESYILFTLIQSAYQESSLKFAQKVEGQFKNKVGRVSRGVKQAGFVVLWRTTMPSVLIETGFLSNPTEENFLATEQGQELVASGIYRAFKEYKNEVESIKSLN